MLSTTQWYTYATLIFSLRNLWNIPRPVPLHSFNEVVSKLNNIGSDNGLSPGRRHAITRSNAVILSICPLGRKIREMLIKIRKFLLKKCAWKCRLENGGHFFLDLNVLMDDNDALEAAAIAPVFPFVKTAASVFKGLFMHTSQYIWSSHNIASSSGSLCISVYTSACRSPCLFPIEAM